MKQIIKKKEGAKKAPSILERRYIR